MPATSVWLDRSTPTSTTSRRAPAACRIASQLVRAGLPCLLLNRRAGEAAGAHIDPDQTRNADVLAGLHRLAVQRRTRSVRRLNDLPHARKLRHSRPPVQDTLHATSPTRPHRDRGLHAMRQPAAATAPGVTTMIAFTHLAPGDAAIASATHQRPGIPGAHDRNATKALASAANAAPVLSRGLEAFAQRSRCDAPSARSRAVALNARTIPDRGRPLVGGRAWQRST